MDCVGVDCVGVTQDALAQLLSDLRRDLTIAVSNVGRAESDAKAATVRSYETTDYITSNITQ